MVAGWLMIVMGVRRRSVLGTTVAFAGLALSRRAIKPGRQKAETSQRTIKLMKVA
jgi:hypothetical protein